MRLTTLRLENFGGFEDETLALHPQLTVLVGRNGSGKSSVIGALTSVLSHLVEAYGWVALNTIWSPRSQDVRVDARHLAVTLHADGIGRIRLEWPGGGSDSVSLRWDGRRLPVLVALQANRAGYQRDRDKTFPELRPDAPATAEAWFDFAPNLGNTFAEVVPWFRREENLENEVRLRRDPSFRRPELSAARRALLRFLNALGGAVYADPRIARVGPTGAPLAADGALVIDKDGTPLELDQHSDGERLLIYTVIDLARRLVLANPESSEPLNGDGVVLIDEIELHLHPGWQRRVLPALTATFPGLQFVVTTHSPQVLGSVAAESVRLLDRFKVWDSPPTLGRDSNSLLEDVFGVPERADEARAKLADVATRIDADDLDGARAALHVLEGALTPEDPEVARLRSLVDFLAS